MSARALFLVPASLAILAALPAPAAADGLPAVGVDAAPLSAPGGKVAYVTRRAKHATRLIETARDSGAELRTRRIRGVFSVPAVAYDGSASGLSADGRRLVLISPRRRFPRAETTFAVIDARQLRLVRHIRLRGDFSFDAISSSGRLMYLIQYLSPTDFTSYAVRAYDMRARRLLRRPVVDPSEPDEDMGGLPMSRTTDSEGRWAYTLYDGHEHPFVHALDTARRRAVCIDLVGLDLPKGGLWAVQLEIVGDRLHVVTGAKVLARIDTSTHRLIRRAVTRAEDGGSPWLPIAGPTAALVLLAAVGRRRSTRTAAP